MYLNDILNDDVMLIVLITLAMVGIILGWRNYRSPLDHKPFTPLGKYLLRLSREQRDHNTGKHQNSYIVKLEALLAILAGALMLGVTLLTMVFLSLK